MIRLLLIILLTLAMCSCRSHKEAMDDFSIEVSADASGAQSCDSLSKILSVLHSLVVVDIAGISVEFFPPDSLHPDIRAIPKAIHIDSVNISSKTNATRLEEDKVKSKETVNLHSTTSSKSKKKSKSEFNSFSLNWFITFSIIIAAVLVSIFIYFKFFHKLSK